MHKNTRSKYIFLVYLLPIVLLIIIATVPKFNTGKSEENEKKQQNKAQNESKNPKIAKFGDIPENEDGEPLVDVDEFGMIESRIPVYPGAEKVKLDQTKDVTEAVFYSTDDPVEEVFKWYEDRLNIYENRVMLVDFTRDGVRTVTMTMPDEPKELVEIKRPFFGLDETGITITTMRFYTSSQPRWMGVDEDKTDEETTDENDEPDEGETNA